jgi:hypothetical protein
MMKTDPRLQQAPESRDDKTPSLSRAAALPGADRRILRKRLEWPFKLIAKQPRVAGRGSR